MRNSKEFKDTDACISIGRDNLSRESADGKRHNYQNAICTCMSAAARIRAIERDCFEPPASVGLLPKRPLSFLGVCMVLLLDAPGGKFFFMEPEKLGIWEGEGLA